MSNRLYRLGILCLCLLIGTFADKTLAQPAGVPSPPEGKHLAQKQVIGQGVKHNFVSIEKVMREIHQLMFQGQFTPKQDTEVSEMMTRLGIMMQEMSGSRGEKLAEKHEQELLEIRRRIEIIRQQLKENK
jgi:hypothetical protein